MAEGLERRASPVDNLRGQEAVNPVTRSVPSVGSAPTPTAPVNSYGQQIAQRVNQYTQGALAQIQAKRQERSANDGQIAAMQGASFESVEMEGDKWALEGWRVVTAQTLSAGLLRAQENEINTGAYELGPDEYRATLVNRIDSMTADIPDERTRQLARDQLMSQMPTLVDTHMRQNLGFQEQQNFDALASSVDTLSRDNSSTGALIAFANGTSEATAGLSQERRRTAVVQGVINAFTNNNPAAYAHLEAAGFFTTDNLTASQIQQVQSAQAAYHSRMEQSWSAEWQTSITELEDQVALGEIGPIAAAERLAQINATHGRRTTAAQAGQVYDAARAGVEFSEGTRGLNVAAAGAAGDYDLQARLMQAAVIQQESGGNPNAVSSVGATGIMQLMPGTAMQPGFGVRNIFQVARDMGVPVMGETRAVAETLMRNPDVNKAMGTEYLSTMLERYNGSVEHALVAYNWGAANADTWDGDHSKLPAETQGYLRNILGSINDDRPDPQADRIAAERDLEQIRQQNQLQVLEAMGPAMAANDELFTSGQIPLEEWRASRQSMYSDYGMALDAQRINQEQQMMRSVVGDQIAALTEVQDVQTAVQLETSLAAAEVQLEERQAAFTAGTSDLTLDQINEEYMTSVVGAYESSGATLDADRISSSASDLVTQSSQLVSQALRAQEESAIIMNAETAGTVGTLPAPLMDRAVGNFREFLGNQIANYRAENPEASPAEIGAMERAAEVEYLATNGIVDDALKQQINLAASGRWIAQDGSARPSTVVGLHNFVSLMAQNPSLAYQYVPDSEARGRMLAATHMVTSMFPDRDVFTDVDLSNRNDPVANAFYDAVQQVGLNLASPPSEEETATRINRAVREANSGNIRNEWFGGWGSTSAANSLVPAPVTMFLPPDSAVSNAIPGFVRNSRAALSGTYDMADIAAARGIDRDAIDNQFIGAVTSFMEEVVPHMPGVDTNGAVSTAMRYVTDHGALMGNSFVMPPVGSPSARALMFPGETVNNPAAVNTAIVGWMQDESVRENNPLLQEWYEANAPGAEFVRALNPFNSRNPGTRESPQYTVAILNGQYVANIMGVGSIVLPLEEIGNHYKSNR